MDTYRYSNLSSELSCVCRHVLISAGRCRDWIGYLAGRVAHSAHNTIEDPCNIDNTAQKPGIGKRKASGNNIEKMAKRISFPLFPSYSILFISGRRNVWNRGN